MSAFGRVIGFNSGRSKNIRGTPLPSGQEELSKRSGLVLQWGNALRHRDTEDLGRQAGNYHHGPGPSPSGMLVLSQLKIASAILSEAKNLVWKG